MKDITDVPRIDLTSLTDEQVIGEYFSSIGSVNVLVILAEADMAAFPHFPWLIRFLCGDFLNGKTKRLFDLAETMVNETVTPLREEMERRGIENMIEQADLSRVH
jgi:hypothetical protein